MQLHVCELIAGLNEEKPEWAAIMIERDRSSGRDREDRSLIALLRYAIQLLTTFCHNYFAKCEKLGPNGQQVLLSER